MASEDDSSTTVYLALCTSDLQSVMLSEGALFYCCLEQQFYPGRFSIGLGDIANITIL